MRAIIDGVTYEFDADVRLIHDRGGDRILFEPMQPVLALTAPPKPAHGPAPKPAHGPAPKRHDGSKGKKHKLTSYSTKLGGNTVDPKYDPDLAARVIATLREQGATSTRGMTWRIYGLSASRQQRSRLHGVLVHLVDAGQITARKRSKTAQFEFAVRDAGHEVTSDTETAA